MENLEDVSNAESNVVAVSNGSSILVPESSAAHSSKIVQFAEFSTHVASFNIVSSCGIGMGCIFISVLLKIDISLFV